MPTYKITLVNESAGLNQTIDCADDEYILDAALEKGLDLSHSKIKVPCTECVGKLIKGTVDQSDQSILNNQQMGDGYVLLCAAYPRSDCTIETEKQEELY